MKTSAETRDEVVGEYLQKRVYRTYALLRKLSGGALIILPLLIASIGYFLIGHIEPSLSDYYYTLKDGGLLRSLFVMFLAFLGGVLVAYRGFDGPDGWIHNVAGICAVCVAIFPMECDSALHHACVSSPFPTWVHYVAVGMLYAGAFASVWYAGGPKLQEYLEELPEPGTLKKKLSRIRIIPLILMTVGIVTYLFKKLVLGDNAHLPVVFWVEYLGFLGFGIYWIRLLFFIKNANKKGHETYPGIPEAKGVPSIEASVSVVEAGRKGKVWVDIP